MHVEAERILRSAETDCVHATFPEITFGQLAFDVLYGCGHRDLALLEQFYLELTQDVIDVVGYAVASVGRACEVEANRLQRRLCEHKGSAVTAATERRKWRDNRYAHLIVKACHDTGVIVIHADQGVTRLVRHFASV
jgi:hypothetical protein